MNKLSTENYKGVRDFYPEDQFIQNYIFDKMRKTAESFGYLEYSASILEPSELYKQKSGEEIVNEQTYTFKDRADREVTLRPEMTPTIARMIAAKEKELSFPLRWYSIPNLFRYEKPQRGRLREHFQLNVDMFGVESLEAEVEVITLAYKLMKNLGGKDDDFVIKLNNRKISNDLFNKFNLDDDSRYKLSKLLDKKSKLSKEDFQKALSEVIPSNWQEFDTLLDSNENLLQSLGSENLNVLKLVSLIEKLLERGVKNVVFDPTIMRGFDYYTETVFEVFDTNEENNRSLFGGGRYDDLLDIFGGRKIPAFGFGMGDVTARDFMESHNLIPEYKPKTDLYICHLKEEYLVNINQIAETLRTEGINVATDLTNKKVGDQIKTADRQKIPYIICVGEDEIKNDIYTLKELKTGIETKTKLEDIVKVIKKSL
jgi:histidyl-tRNA synthetase